jgi:serine/threonine-protein kinase
VSSGRFRVVTALPPDGGWRTELAVDRSAAPPRPVVLARVPPAVTGDASVLAALLRGVELAARADHPAILPVLGLAETGGGLAVLGPFREGETVRAVLTGGGPLSPALAARVAFEVAMALQAAHGLAGAGDRALCHGDVRAERVLVAEDGAVLLVGLGRPAEARTTPADDLRAAARLLEACLAPAGQGTVPPELAAVVERALGPEGYASGAALAAAVASAVSPATPAALAARVAAAVPAGGALRSARRRALVVALREEGAPVAADEPPVHPAEPPAHSPPPPPLRSAAGAVAVGRRDEPPAAPPAAPAPAGVAVAVAVHGEGETSAAVAEAPLATSSAPEAPAPAGRSLLDDDRLPALSAVVCGLAGLLLGWLAGR